MSYVVNTNRLTRRILRQVYKKARQRIENQNKKAWWKGFFGGGKSKVKADGKPGTQSAKKISNPGQAYNTPMQLDSTGVVVKQRRLPRVTQDPYKAIDREYDAHYFSCLRLDGAEIIIRYRKRKGSVRTNAEKTQKDINTEDAPNLIVDAVVLNYGVCTKVQGEFTVFDEEQYDRLFGQEKIRKKILNETGYTRKVDEYGVTSVVPVPGEELALRAGYTYPSVYSVPWDFGVVVGSGGDDPYKIVGSGGANSDSLDDTPGVNIAIKSATYSNQLGRANLDLIENIVWDLSKAESLKREGLSIEAIQSFKIEWELDLLTREQKDTYETGNINKHSHTETIKAYRITANGKEMARWWHVQQPTHIVKEDNRDGYKGDKYIYFGSKNYGVSGPLAYNRIVYVYQHYWATEVNEAPETITDIYGSWDVYTSDGNTKVGEVDKTDLYVLNPGNELTRGDYVYNTKPIIAGSRVYGRAEFHSGGIPVDYSESNYPFELINQITSTQTTQRKIDRKLFEAPSPAAFEVGYFTNAFVSLLPGYGVTKYRKKFEDPIPVPLGEFGIAATDKPHTYYPKGRFVEVPKPVTPEIETQILVYNSDGSGEYELLGDGDEGGYVAESKFEYGVRTSWERYTELSTKHEYNIHVFNRTGGFTTTNHVIPFKSEWRESHGATNGSAAFHPPSVPVTLYDTSYWIASRENKGITLSNEVIYYDKPLLYKGLQDPVVISSFTEYIQPPANDKYWDIQITQVFEQSRSRRKDPAALDAQTVQWEVTARKGSEMAVVQQRFGTLSDFEKKPYSIEDFDNPTIMDQRALLNSTDITQSGVLMHFEYNILKGQVATSGQTYSDDVDAIVPFIKSSNQINGELLAGIGGSGEGIAVGIARANSNAPAPGQKSPGLVLHTIDDVESGRLDARIEYEDLGVFNFENIGMLPLRIEDQLGSNELFFYARPIPFSRSMRAYFENPQLTAAKTLIVLARE